jgi:predicted Rdx family selenoprotein
VATEILVGWAPVLTGLELKTGSHGVFRVFLDGDPVFDKSDARRMPRAGELARIFEARLGAPLSWRKDRSH